MFTPDKSTVPVSAGTSRRRARPCIGGAQPAGENRLLKLKFGWGEWLGAFGDLSVLLTALLGLAAICGMSPGKPLLLIGVYYLASSFFFRLPIPVQPMKLMLAVMLAENPGIGALQAGAILIGVLLLLISMTGGLHWIRSFFTEPLIGGIQLGIGILLLLRGLDLILAGSATAGAVSWTTTHMPSANDFIAGAWILVLPQFPLTLGNAVFSTSAAAHHYFGRNAFRVSPTNLVVSMGAANIIMGVLGGIPVCHGSGGLTAHYRFGARTGGATIIIGGVCVLAGMSQGHHVHAIVSSIPLWMLGLVMIYVAFWHASLAMGVGRARWISLLTGLLTLITGGLFVPFLAGLVLDRTFAGSPGEHPKPRAGSDFERRHGGSA